MVEKYPYGNLTIIRLEAGLIVVNQDENISYLIDVPRMYITSFKEDISRELYNRFVNMDEGNPPTDMPLIQVDIMRHYD